MSKRKIRRRTRRLSSKRIIIYMIVIAMVVCADYLYHTFVSKSGEPTLLEQIVDTYNAQVEGTKESKPKQVTPKQTEPKQNSPQAQSSSKQSDTYRQGWAELPVERENQDLLYAHHTLSNGTRNYSVCYSKSHHCPMWVAVPLHKSYKGELKRKDSYNYDPKIAINHQISLKRSYGEYTRGHMLASSDRTVSEEANLQTFYVTNIAPQIQAGFNAANGAWNYLESFVEKQVCADTLYVVMGTLFKAYTDVDGMTIEPTQTTNRSDQKQVSVPTAYYQALLRTRSGKSGRSVMESSKEELKCAAFIVGHRSAKGRKPSRREMISIEELERLTGVEFFANVANAPKSEAKSEDWGL